MTWHHAFHNVCVWGIHFAVIYDDMTCDRGESTGPVIRGSQVLYLNITSKYVCKRVTPYSYLINHMNRVSCYTGSLTLPQVRMH